MGSGQNVGSFDGWLGPSIGGGGGGGVQSVVPGTGIAVDNTDPQNPIVSQSPASPLLQLALSYGQGTSVGVNDLNAGESFWFQAQAVNSSPGADQIHEWPTPRALAFIGLTIFVDDATIVLTGDEPRFIVTVDGIDTIFQATLSAGAHTEEILQTSGFVSVPANSRIGVRFDGAGIDAGSTLRCEMILDGAVTGAPVPPPPIPVNGLLLDLASENYALTPTTPGNATALWTDDSAQGNDFFHGNAGTVNLPTIEAAAFNADPGVAFDRALTFELSCVAGGTNWYTANQPRTVVMVIRGDNIQPGCMLNVRRAGPLGHEYTMVNVAAPQIIFQHDNGAPPPPADKINSTDFFDLTGQKAVLMWWTDGGVGDALNFTVNGVTAPLDALMGLETGPFTVVDLGFDSDIFFPDSKRFAGAFARVLTYNRVLTVSERIGVLSNLTQRYL